MVKYMTINSKKIAYKLALFLFVIGASLILGFLSFGGMFALLPLLPLAIAAFVLSVAYEGEIYKQNIKGALDKLFKNNYLKNQLAKEYLLKEYLPKRFPKHPKNAEDIEDKENAEDKEDEEKNDYPEFLGTYEKQLKLLDAFGDKRLTKTSKKQKKKIEKTLKDMDKLFALQLFPAHKNQKKGSPYIEELRVWLAKEEQHRAKWQTQLKKRGALFYWRWSLQHRLCNLYGH